MLKKQTYVFQSVNMLLLDFI